MKSAHRPANVCILDFNGDAADHGDQASAWETIRLLNRCWRTAPPFALYTVPALSPGAGRAVGDATRSSLVRQALEIAEPDQLQRETMLRIASDWFGPLVETLAAAELVIMQGCHDEPRESQDLQLLRGVMPWVARHVFGRPVVWLNQADAPPLRPVRDSTGRPSVCDATLWLRDPPALRRAVADGWNGGRLVPDAVFLTEPLEHGPTAQQLDGQRYFCVGGNVPPADAAACLQAVQAVVAATGLVPVFIGDGSEEADRLHAAVAARGIAAVVMPGDAVYQAVADVLSRAEFLLCGRPRLAMLAAIGGTPTVPIGFKASFQGMCELLDVEWAALRWDDVPGVTLAARRLSCQPPSLREKLRRRVARIRTEIEEAYEAWAPPLAPPLVRPSTLPRPTGSAAAVRPPRLLSQLVPLTVYLRRGVTPDATFRCLQQLVEGNLGEAVQQLDARWLISICDSYADHGDPIASRNGLLISTFLNWERLAATHALWADPSRRTMRIDTPPPGNNVPLWDGIITVHLRRGDTVNNMLVRYGRLLAETPPLLAIWRALLGRIRASDSVLAALDQPHGHLFDEHLLWMADTRLADIPRWRRPPAVTAPDRIDGPTPPACGE